MQKSSSQMKNLEMQDPEWTRRGKTVAGLVSSTFVLLALLTLSAGPARGAELPGKLVGVWATAGTEFEGGRLIGGEALYLISAGRAAIVGAPLPVMRCPDGRVCAPIIGVAGRATFEEATRRLSIQVQDGRNSQTIEGELAPDGATVLLTTGPRQVKRLVRREADVPPALEAQLKAAE